MTLDEYIKRRQGGETAYRPSNIQYGRMAGSELRGPGIVSPNAAPTGVQLDRSGQTAVYNPPRISKPDMVQNPTTVNPTGAGLDASTPTDGAGSQYLTRDDLIAEEIRKAYQKVLEVANRKFQYSPYESPIYSIMRQEYMKEADLAAGRATAAAVQNAGGFGSSYAVMAGEEARRQVMEGFYDQEDELYAAARSEFEAEKASAFDNYLQLIQLDEYERERQARTTPTTLTLADGTTVEVTDEARELYTSFYDSFAQGTGYEVLKTAMLNGGASEADADMAIDMYKRLAGATVSDQVSDFEKNPTLDGAAQIMADAKANGTLDQYTAKISKSAKVALENALKTEGADADAIMAEGAQAVKDGYLSEDDYLVVVTADAHADIKDMETSGKNLTERKRQKRIAQNIEGILDMYNAGQISENMYYKALLEMKPYLDKYFSKNQRKFASELGGLSDGEAEAIYDVVQALEKQKVAKASDNGAKGARAAKERS